jgi:uncharacterized repeat protein (TIGR03803 family)
MVVGVNAKAWRLLYSFEADISIGANPRANLIQGSDGNFHGTTWAGGTNTRGTVIMLRPAGVESVI